MCKRPWWKYTRCGSSWGWRRGGQRELTEERPGAPWLSCRSRPWKPQRERDSISTLCHRCALTLAQRSRPQTLPGDTKRKCAGATEGDCSVMALQKWMWLQRQSANQYHLANKWERLTWHTSWKVSYLHYHAYLSGKEPIESVRKWEAHSKKQAWKVTGWPFITFKWTN